MAKGDQVQAAAIAPQIVQRGLLVNQAFMGTAAWAYYVNMVPRARQREPMVVFDVEERYVVRRNCPLPQNPNYAFMEMPGPLYSYIPVIVLGFVNLPGFPPYQGVIGFI
jgi:hypothetical protein